MLLLFSFERKGFKLGNSLGHVCHRTLPMLSRCCCVIVISLFLFFPPLFSFFLSLFSYILKFSSCPLLASSTCHILTWVTVMSSLFFSLLSAAHASPSSGHAVFAKGVPQQRLCNVSFRSGSLQTTDSRRADAGKRPHQPLHSRDTKRRGRFGDRTEVLCGEGRSTAYTCCCVSRPRRGGADSRASNLPPN